MHVSGASVITQAACNKAILEDPGTLLYPASIAFIFRSSYSHHWNCLSTVMENGVNDSLFGPFEWKRTLGKTKITVETEQARNIRVNSCSCVDKWKRCKICIAWSNFILHKKGKLRGRDLDVICHHSDVRCVCMLQQERQFTVSLLSECTEEHLMNNSSSLTSKQVN